jgi:hypothetical protein
MVCRKLENATIQNHPGAHFYIVLQPSYAKMLSRVSTLADQFLQISYLPGGHDAQGYSS